MTDNRTTELMPCPHCGKVDTLEFATRRELEDCPNFDDCEAETCGRGFCDVYDNWDCVVCSVNKGGCGASGGYDECPSKAIEKWNTRTPEQAIAATLGDDPKSMRVFDSMETALTIAEKEVEIEKLKRENAELCDENAELTHRRAELEAATLGGGKLTADWVRGFLERHSMFDDASWTHGTTELVFDEDELPAMADELNTTLGVEVNGDTSDGYHTFNELYYHRTALFACLVALQPRQMAFKSWKHSDGTMYEGMFIAGIYTAGGWCTYHCEAKWWPLFDCYEREFAPEWDGHTPSDAIHRLMSAFLPSQDVGGEVSE